MMLREERKFLHDWKPIPEKDRLPLGPEPMNTHQCARCGAWRPVGPAAFPCPGRLP